MMTDSLGTLAKSVTGQLANLQSVDQIDGAARHRLAEELAALLQEVQPPMTALLALNAGSRAMVTTKVASGMGVFDAFAAKNNKAMSFNELREQCRGDQILLLRVLRILSTHGIVKQVSKHEWAPTEFGAGFTTDSLPSHLLEHQYEMMKVHAVMDEYIRQQKYQNPSDAFNGPWQYAYDTPKHYFDWLADHEQAQKSFNAVMTFQQQFRGLQNWFDFFPVQTKLQTTSNDSVILVDIGGGVGHDALAFRQAFPQLEGRVVLEDLPKVMEAIKHPLPANYEAIGYDFFTEQPIKGARLYYMRTVLHDWPDKQALQILKRIREACTSDSVLLINEGIVSEEKLLPMTANLDMIMMTVCSSQERTETQWFDLIAQAGFEVVNVWKPDDFAVTGIGLFEAVPV